MSINRLESERLILRHFTLEDAEEMFSSYASDQEVTRYLSWHHHESVEQTKMILGYWIKEYEDLKTERFAIILRATGELIGGIDIVDFVDGKPEVGYVLARRYWNNGYMSEACKLFLSHLEQLGYKEIVIEANENNIGSNKVIEKCGFTFTHKETKPNSRFKPEIITVNWYKKSS